MSAENQGSGRLRRVLGDVDLSGLGDPVAEIAIFSGAKDPAEVDRRLHDHVATEVDAILELTKEFDAFDIIELMRMREIPITPVAGLDPNYDGSAAAIELIALVLLTRAGRRITTVPREDTRPHEAIGELHHRAKRLLRLAIYRAKTVEKMRGSDPLARLSAEYQSYLVGVRALQYDSILSAHERALFDRPEIDRLLSENLGFTHREFGMVRDAIQDHYSEILTGLRDLTGDIVMTAEAQGRKPTAEEADVFTDSMVAMMFLPGERAAFTSTQIASHGRVDEQLVERALDRFSLDFSPSTDPARSVTRFLHAQNPLAGTQVIRENGKHLRVAGSIGGESFRVAVEDALKDGPGWERYNSIRRDVSESLAVESLARLLGCRPQATNLEHFAPRPGIEVSALDRDCSELTTVGVMVEADALFIIDDVAVCLEVKGRSIAEPARRGDLARLEAEIKKVLGSGAHQARRLETLIRENGGVWDRTRTWVDLRHVREIRTVVAGLDYFGPLGIALGDLADTRLFGDGSLPWIASIHDLDVVSRVIDRPAEFLLYLRRRTDSGVAKHYRGSDELDLFMLFMDGGLFVEDDPDEIHRLHPRSSPPTRTERARHEQADRPTFVGTFTDPLDAWMYWIEGSNPEEVEKPVFNVDPDAADLVDFLADGRKPGWFRIGADLLGLAGHAQRKLMANLQGMVERTRTDGQPHSLVQGFPSSSGFMTFFAGTMPAGSDRRVEAERLRTYMAAKKHQVASDRSIGLLMNERGLIVATIYMNDVPQDDEELDELGVAIGLKRSWEKRSRASSVSKKKSKRQRKNRRSS